jgi:hypothetical protein
MTEAHLFVIGILLAWLAGIRVYLTVFGVGLAGLLGWVDLPPPCRPPNRGGCWAPRRRWP